MKIKKDPFNIGQMEKETAKKKREMRRMEKEEARRKKEIARKESEEAKREMDAERKDSNLEKYRIVLERLQINWIKWNITCVALGFTSYRFYYSRVHSGEDPLGVINGWHIGIFLISLGFITLILATLQHRENVMRLKSQFETMQYSLSLKLSYVIIVFSLLIMLLVIFKG